MKFFSRLICPLGQIPNVDIEIFDKATLKNYNGQWFLIENEFYSTLEMFDISLGFEDGVFIKTQRNQTIYTVDTMQFMSLIDMDTKTIFQYSTGVESKFWPEFINLTEEAALYIKMKHLDDIVFMDYT